MENTGITTGDLALMRDGNDFAGSSFMWIFALLILMFGGNGFGNGRGLPMMGGDYVTQADLSAGLNNQQTQTQLQQIALSSANNNYETARLIQTQTTDLLQQNNTNLINAIQGFNQVNQTLTNQTNVLSNQIQALGAQLNQCCCDIKTQMLQDRLDATQAALTAAQGTISNSNQSQYILGQLGRFVAWTASGTNGAVAATT